MLSSSAPAIRLGLFRGSGKPKVRSASGIRQAAPVTAFSLFAALAAAIVPPTMNGRAPDEGDLLIGLLTATTVFIVLYSAWAPSQDIFSPLPLISGMVLIQYVVRAIYLRDGPDGRLPGPANIQDDYQSYIIPTLELVTTCYGALVLAFLSPIPGLLVRILPRTPALSADVGLGRLAIVICIGVAANLYMKLTNQLSAFLLDDSVHIDLATRHWVVVAMGLLVAAQTITLALYFRGGPNARSAGVVSAALFLLQVATGLYAGGKGATFWPFVVLALSYHYFRRRVGLLHLATLTSILVFLVFPLITKYRAVYATDTHRIATIEQSAQYASRAATEVSQNDNFMSDSLLAALNRLSEFDCPMIALKMTPRFIPWADPTPYAMFPIMAVVPRAIWPDKPPMVILPNWERDYWGDHTGGSSITRSMIGALYCAFGFWGAVIGLALHGFAVQTTYLYLHRDWGPLSLAIYVTILQSIMALGLDIPTVWAGLIQTFVIMIPVCAFLADRTRRSARAWA